MTDGLNLNIYTLVNVVRGDLAEAVAATADVDSDDEDTHALSVESHLLGGLAMARRLVQTSGDSDRERSGQLASELSLIERHVSRGDLAAAVAVADGLQQRLDDERAAQQ